jgi:protease-4
VQTGKYSDLGNPTRAMTDGEGLIIQNEVNKTYATFLQRVAEGRGSDTAAIHLIAQGRVWTGNQALKNGLVDVLGNKETAIKLAAQRCNVSQYRVVEYPKERDAFSKILDDLKGDQEAKALKEKLGIFAAYYEQLVSFQTWTGVQTRLPFELIIK